MEKYFSKGTSKKSLVTQGSSVKQKRPCIELNMHDIVADLGLRKPIEEFDHDIRDDTRRAFLAMGPFKPFGHDFPGKDHGIQTRAFVNSWFTKFD